MAGPQPVDFDPFAQQTAPVAPTGPDLSGLGPIGANPTRTPTPVDFDPFGNSGIPPYPLYPGGPDLGPVAQQTIGQGLSGFNEFIAGVADIPFRIGAGLYALAGGKYNPNNPIESAFAQGEPVTAAGRAIGAIQPPPTTGLGEAFNTGGNFAAGSLGIGAAARILTPIMRPGMARGIVRSMAPRTGLEQTADVAKGFAAGVGSGAGAQVGGEIGQRLTGTEAGRATGADIGGLAGAFAGGVFPPTRMLIGPVRFLARLFGKQGMTELSERLVHSTIGHALEEPGALQKLQAGQKAAETIPGFSPSIAESTGSASLIREQRAIQDAASNSKLEFYAGRRQANLDAIDRFYGFNTPDGPSVNTVIDTATKKVTAVSQGLDEASAALANKELPRANPERTGAILRARLLKLKDTARQYFNKQASIFQFDRTNVRDAFAQFADTLIPQVAPRSVFAQGGDLSPLIGDRIVNMARRIQAEDAAAAAGQPVENPVQIRFSDLKYLREKLSDGIIDAMSGAAPNKAYVRQLVIAKKQLDDTLLNLPLGPEYKAFIQDYFKNYVQRFEQGAAFKVTSKDQRGFYQTAPERVASLFNGGSYSDALQYRTAFGEDKRAMLAFTAATTDDLAQSVVRNGAVDVKALEKWKADHAGLLRAFPEFQATPENLLVRQQAINATREAAENTALSRAVAAHVSERTPPEKVIGDAIKNPALGRELLDAIKGDPQATAAAARQLWQSAPMDKTLDDWLNNPFVKGVLSPEHINNLRTIFDARNMVANVSAPTGQAVDIAPLGLVQKTIGFKIPQVASRMFAVTSGRTSERFVLSEGAMRVFNRMGIAQGKQLLEKALFDPDVASAIATSVRFDGKRYVPGVNTPLRLQPWLYYYGLSVGSKEKK